LAAEDVKTPEAAAAADDGIDTPRWPDRSQLQASEWRGKPLPGAWRLKAT